eukprot:1175480-Prorocentrum_minimum.AAC.3
MATCTASPPNTSSNTSPRFSSETSPYTVGRPPAAARTRTHGAEEHLPMHFVRSTTMPTSRPAPAMPAAAATSTRSAPRLRHLLPVQICNRVGAPPGVDVPEGPAEGAAGSAGAAGSGAGHAVAATAG